MDIICKCGHYVDAHILDGSINYGCCAITPEKSERGGLSCNCQLSPSQVYEIHITEQQARLDTNRAQVEALIAERDALKAQKLELIKAVELFLDCKYDADEKARKILGEMCDGD